MHKKNALPHQWQVLNNSTGAGIVDGEFDVMLLGAPGVGKTRSGKLNIRNDLVSPTDIVVSISLL